jgi:hypothetical protein
MQDALSELEPLRNDICAAAIRGRLMYLDYRIACSGRDEFFWRGLCNAAHWDSVAARKNPGSITQHYEPFRVKRRVLFVLGVRLFHLAAAPEFAFDACTFAAVFKQRDPISIGLHCRST